VTSAVSPTASCVRCRCNVWNVADAWPPWLPPPSPLKRTCRQMECDVAVWRVNLRVRALRACASCGLDWLTACTSSGPNIHYLPLQPRAHALRHRRACNFCVRVWCVRGWFSGSSVLSSALLCPAAALCRRQWVSIDQQRKNTEQQRKTTRVRMACTVGGWTGCRRGAQMSSDSSAPPRTAPSASLPQLRGASMRNGHDGSLVAQTCLTACSVCRALVVVLCSPQSPPFFPNGV
jgi:hypothetical protein